MRILVLLSMFISSYVSASCAAPELIPDGEQLELRKKSTLKLIDKDFVGQNGLDIFRFYVPSSYKDISIYRAYYSVWNGDELVFHSSLGIADEFEPSERYLEFGINRFATGVPVITVVYGNMCYNMHRLVIDNFQDFTVIHNAEEESYFENQHWYFSRER
ncbi:hypothetical protein H1D31_15485 [Alishewanella sp. BS5-314]|uniref:hypothetical protein n=1 Tax=Alishewanella sp. BS5-314 TaxID=2755587 RepID=UPI0021BABE13|nr:hypothetical protein [Alishewanella sp. BS5-314]MCT8127411.1 hypothetical protein [Alishewanella sp. BS5-314]